MVTEHETYRFQSTPPAWGATQADRAQGFKGYCFNPRPPRGGRPEERRTREAEYAVSIHAPRVGGDA